MNQTVILGIRISDRLGEAGRVQSILTKYGCTIRTRLGLHDVDAEYVSPAGLIILELAGDPAEYLKLENELTGLDGVTVRKMEF